MRLFRPRTVAALALVLSLVVDPACAMAGRAELRYVALGDSYSAGVGSAGSESGGGCRRNTNSYPARWAKAHPGYDAVLAACAGAGTETVRRSQLSSLTAATTLVTLTAGGNDVGFAGTMTVCVVDPRPAPCLTGAAQGGKLARTVLPGRLRQLYREIRGRSPEASVLVLGYPRFFHTGRLGCSLLTTPEREAINDTIDALNQVIETEATAAGFRYVDVRPLFAGHGACAATPWLNAVTFPPGNSFHPNDAGQRDGYLAAMNAELR
ncbi:lysophospholipase L1-like esterase [Actinoplanes tereljensis]|uniref:Lipase 1 n=1 Tax=Paractinoplanes tereljensis TaxID=571912 RepID=A0A919NN33_9ACTN|nr:SGNH/GDSL hydrolase family protein [Actinoplanes tereljensis]GIF21150.1 lipase 1 [Actinoplanes tereljensis]